MAGGTWIDQNKVRPGVYINYKSAPSSLATMGERGVVAIARQLDWAEKGKFYTIEQPSDCVQLGYTITDDAMLFVRQILLGSNRTQGATKILIWSLEEETGGTDVKASGSIGNLTLEAVEAGKAGNKITVTSTADGSDFVIVTSFDGTAVDSQTVATIAALVDNDYVKFGGTGSLSAGTSTLQNGIAYAAKASASQGNLIATANDYGTYGNRLSLSVTAGPSSNFIVQTLLDNQVVDSQTVATISGLAANPYCSFSGTGTITTTSEPVLFTGGANGDLTSSAYSNFLTALELQKFDIVIYDGTDDSIKSTFAGFAKRLSDNEGVKCQAVLSDAAAPDSECVINVYPQAVTLSDGTKLAASELTWWVGGASAGANAFESLTYASYPDAVSISPVLNASQQEASINAGKFALISQFEKIQVLTDINSFTTFAVEKGKAFRKNRVIRTVFGLCNDIYKAFALYYIGAVHNDDEGRKALKAEILNLMNRYQGNRALQNVEADDVTVMAGVESDAVVIEIYCQPVDSIEKIYINITIS